MREHMMSPEEWYLKRSERRRNIMIVLGILGCIVFLWTVYALMFPVDTMEKITYCEDEIHEHTLACFSNPEADIEHTKDWEESLQGTKLTGEWAADLLAIAETQLDYRESTKNYRVSTDGISVDGYNRYQAWDGDGYGDWNVAFASFCMEYAGVKEIPVMTDPQEWLEALSSNEVDLYRSESAYTPRCGDIVFLNSSGDEGADCVGFVAELIEATVDEPAKLKVIEGDVNGKVQYQTYSLMDDAILGYCDMASAKEAFDDRRELKNTAEKVGDDYRVSVQYSDISELPQDGLTVIEIPRNDTRYQDYHQPILDEWYAQYDGDLKVDKKITWMRIFDIHFAEDDKEVEPLAPVYVTIALPEIPDGVIKVAHFLDDGSVELVDANVSVNEAGETLLTFATESFSDFVAYAESGTISETASNFYHNSFGAVTGYTDGQVLQTGTGTFSSTVATGNYDSDSIYGALYGNVLRTQSASDGDETYPGIKIFSTEKVETADNPWWGDNIGYVVQEGDHLFVRMKVSNVTGNMGDVTIRVRVNEDWNNLYGATLETVNGEYAIYSADLSDVVGKTLVFAEVAWLDAEVNAGLDYIIDYVSVRQPSGNVFQTHFSVGEVTDSATGEISINNTDLGYLSPLSTNAEWTGGGKITSLSVQSSLDTRHVNTHNGYLHGTFAEASSPNAITKIASDYSLNYTIQEGDYLQVRIRVNLTSGELGTRYKVNIGGRDFPVESGKNPDGTIGGGRKQLNYTIANANGFESQQSYQIITLPLDKCVGWTIDWMQIQLVAADDTTITGEFYVDHIRIGGLALGVDEKGIAKTEPLEREDNLETVGQNNIDFRLYNYGSGINGSSDTSAEDYNPLKGFFEFRGRSRLDNFTNQRVTFNPLDADGYNDKAYQYATDSSLDLTSSNNTSTYNGTTYFNRRAKVLSLLQNGYPVFDGTAISTDMTEVQLVPDTSLGYLFGVGDHPAVSEYDPTNTILKHPTLVQNGINYTDTYTYVYNSAENAVDYDISKNIFYLRNYVERSDELAEHVASVTHRTYGDFLPFTYWDGETLYRLNDDPNGVTFNYDGDNEEEYWFGMQMRLQFYQPEDGKIVKDLVSEDSSSTISLTEDMVFEFSGDDDVMVFVDNVLILDLTGTHGVVSGSINFATGEILQYIDWAGSYGVDSGDVRVYNTTIAECYEAAGVEPSGGWNDAGTTFADYSAHNLRFFYLERGTSVANCYMKFNLTTLPANSLLVGKLLETDEDVTYIENDDSYAFQILKAQEVIGTDGTVTYEPTNELFIGPNTAYTIFGEEGTYYTDANGYFYLKVGQHALFEELPITSENRMYFVKEVLSEEQKGQFSATYYQMSTGDDTETSGDNRISGDTSGVISAADVSHVDFINVIDASRLGSLRISKTVSGDSTDEAFAFKVTLDGEPIPIGTTYTLTAADGTVSEGTVTEEGRIYLKHGENAVIDGIMTGVVVRVKETELDTTKYVAQYTTTGDGVTFTRDTDDEDELYVEFEMIASTEDGGTEVTVDTVNETTYLTTTIRGNKMLRNPDGLERSYTFRIQRVVSSGDHTPIGDPQTVSVTFPAGITTADSIQSFEISFNYVASELTEKTTYRYWYLITEDQGDDVSTVYDSSKYLVLIKVVWRNEQYQVDSPAYYYYDESTSSAIPYDTDETFTFVNVINTVELPHTGGIGAQRVYILGGVLCCLAVMWMLGCGIYERRRRCAGRGRDG